MTTHTSIEVNCTTGEVIERPYTAEEEAAHEASSIQAQAHEAEREAQAQAKEVAKASAAAKLAALGLTVEEIAAL
jgi:hypothetical protein